MCKLDWMFRNVLPDYGKVLTTGNCSAPLRAVLGLFLVGAGIVARFPRSPFRGPVRESGSGERSRCGAVQILPVAARDFVALCSNPVAGKGKRKEKAKERKRQRKGSALG